MDVASGGQEEAMALWIFIHGTDIVDRGLIVLFLVFSIFFSLPSLGNFLSTPMILPCDYRKVTACWLSTFIVFDVDFIQETLTSALKWSFLLVPIMSEHKVLPLHVILPHRIFELRFFWLTLSK